MSEPICGKCGGIMTRENARIRPELFLHDKCLPTEFLPIGGGMMCDTSDRPLPRAYVLKVINERLGWHNDNLAGWREPDGYLVPTEPDKDERRLVRAHLRVAVDVLTELKQALGLVDPS